MDVVVKKINGEKKESAKIWSVALCSDFLYIIKKSNWKHCEWLQAPVSLVVYCVYEHG